jgi:excisionase family DNA binding protein
MITQTPHADQLLTAKQVTERLNISRRTLYRWVQVGKIAPPVYRTQTSARWRPDAISALLGTQTQ